MASHVVLVTDPLAEDGLTILAAHPDIEVRVRPGLGPDALPAAVAEADALLVRSGTRVTAALLEAGRRLRVVGRAGTGVDNIDVAAATRRGVVVMNTPGGNAVAACELTFALLLALLRDVTLARPELARGIWDRKKHMGRQLQGRTLGLIGFGRIGREVAARARAFGMEVLVADPFVTEALAREHECKLLDRASLLAAADVISLHVPLNDETRHLIDAEALRRVKPGAVIVNCARGGLVDEAALLDALETGAVAGAALDVFETEPTGESALLSHPRVVATPHLGASTEEAQKSVAAELAHQVIDFLVGGEVRNAVNMPSLSAEAYTQARPYLQLAERLGSLAGQIAGGDYRRVEVCFRGDCRDLPRDAVVVAALLGLLRCVDGGSAANFVNARLLASELGIEVAESAVADSGDHLGLVEVIVAGAVPCTLAGALSPAGVPRLVRWEGLTVDAPPLGDILALRNPDVPGVVGAIGTILGEAGVNIAHISWGRNPATGEALTLINLDGGLPEEVLERIRAHPHILWASPARLP